MPRTSAKPATAPSSAIAGGDRRDRRERVRESDPVGVLERGLRAAAIEWPQSCATPEPRAPPSWPCAAASTSRSRAAPRRARAARGRARDHVLEDRAEAGDAGGDPDLAEGRVDARGHAAAPCGTTPIAVEASGGFTSPMPAPPRMKPGDQDGPRRARGRARSSSAGRPRAAPARAEQQAHGHAHARAAGDRRHDERQQRDRQEAQAGLHGE